MIKFLSAILFAAEGDQGLFDNPMSIVMIVVLVLLLVGMFILPRFGKKKDTSISELYASLAPGDKVMTVGGIIGTIVDVVERSPTDKDILIKTGAEGSETTIWIDVRGIHQNISKPPRPTDIFGRPKAAAPVAADVPAESVETEPAADFAGEEASDETADQ